MLSFDIAIIGAGPAGATLARLLGDRYKTVIVDKKTDDESSFRKPCGGLLAPQAQAALSRFEITMPRDILVTPQIFAVKTIDLSTGLVRHYQRSYVNMDRNKFDFWLASMIPQHVQRICGNCSDIKREEDGFSFSAGGQRVHTRYIVGADGAMSAVRKGLFPHKPLNRLIAIQQHFEEKNTKPFYSCVFDRSTSKYCSWSLSKDDRFIFGGVFDIKDCRKNFELQKEKLTKAGFVFGDPIKTEACIVLRPRSPFDFCTGKNGAFLIGEAAGFISPSSFEGISWAIDSAYELARVFNSDYSDKNRAYLKKTRKIRIKLTMKLLKCPFLYTQTLRTIVLKSGLSAIKTQ